MLIYEIAWQMRYRCGEHLDNSLNDGTVQILIVFSHDLDRGYPIVIIIVASHRIISNHSLSAATITTALCASMAEHFTRRDKFSVVPPTCIYLQFLARE